MNKVFDSLWEQDLKKQKSDKVFLLVLSVMLAVMVVFTILNQYVFLNVSVSGPSMQPTLQTGDVVVLNRKEEVSVGDIIVIGGVKNYWLIKRVIACEEGDTIEIKDGMLKVNGKIVEEDYVLDGVSARQDDRLDLITLKKGEIFYLGDNRCNSSDSRTYGACKDENVIGVVEEWSLKNRKLRSQFLKYIARIKSVFN
jgi:signal peptidase I